MNLIKWDPVRELEDVTNNLNRLFGRSATRAGALQVADWTPSVDIGETDSAYLIKGELPGISKGDIKVTLQDGLLTIRGERKQDVEEKGKKFHRVECFYGRFERSFRLPDDADVNSVKAEFKDGMLNVILAKTEQAKSKPAAVEIPVS